MFNLNRTFRNNVLIQYEYHNYNFIFFFAKTISMDFIFILDSLIKYK